MDTAKRLAGGEKKYRKKSAPRKQTRKAVNTLEDLMNGFFFALFLSSRDRRLVSIHSLTLVARARFVTDFDSPLINIFPPVVVPRSELLANPTIISRLIGSRAEKIGDNFAQICHASLHEIKQNR
jgi:hypothetical protein